MKERIFLYWEAIKASFWFIPTLMSLTAILLAMGVSQIDSHYGERITKAAPWLETTVESSRAAMSSIAGAMATVAGVVFSTTIVVLSVAASQYGSRLIRTFINDRVTHFTLGAFVATSLYCLLILADIRSGEELGFVPHLSSLVGVLLAVFCMGTFIYFLHNTAMSIQAPHVVKTSASDLRTAIDRIFPEQIGRSSEDPQSGEAIDRAIQQDLARLGGAFHPITGRHEGYIQAIDAEHVLEAARSRDLILILDCRPGDFVTRDSLLARAWPADRADDQAAQAVRDAVIINAFRTPHQDPLYAANELVEIAVRALSPGINDPFTAMLCADRLGAALARLAQRNIPAPRRFDDDGQLRVIARPVAFEDVCDAAFSQIRYHAAQAPAVLARLLEAIEMAAQFASRPGDLACLARHAEAIQHGASDSLREPHDLAAIDVRYRRLRTLLDERSRPGEERGGSPSVRKYARS